MSFSSALHVTPSDTGGNNAYTLAPELFFFSQGIQSLHTAKKKVTDSHFFFFKTL
jgi:hypothetical protein